jgi:hypothetical protein
MAPAYSTFAITVRPRAGITNAQIDGITKWIARTCDYYHIITEKDGSERHLHAGLFMRKDSTRSNLNNCLLALTCLKSLEENEKRVLREGTKIMYDWNFVNVYLKKEDPFHKDIATVLPSIDEREIVGEQRFPAKDDKRMEHKFEGDPWLLKMEALFKEWMDARMEPVCDGPLVWPEGGTPGWETGNMYFRFVAAQVMGQLGEMVVSTFYNSMMYEQRLVKVERDPRRAKNNVGAMVKFFAKYAGASTTTAKRARGEDAEEPYLEQHLNCPRCEDEGKDSPYRLEYREQFCALHKRYEPTQ